MPKDEKTPSADEIIEALALEMGVDGESEEGQPEKAKAAGPPAIPKDSEKAEAVAAPEEPAAEPEPAKEAAAPKPKAEEAPAPEPKAEPVAEAKPEPKAAEPAPKAEEAPAAPSKPGKGLYQDVHSGLDHLFNTSGKDEDAYVADYYGDDDLDDPTPGTGRIIFGLVAVFAITIVGLGATYLAIPEDKRADVPTLAKCYVPTLDCVDLQEQRRTRRAEEERIRREAWLDSLPKYGNLTVRTTPSYGQFSVDDLESFQEHPTRPGSLVETRSGTFFENLLVTEPHVVVVTMPNFQERRIEVPPWGNPDTLWQQRQDTGEYFLEMNEIMVPVPELAMEMGFRMTPSAEVPELIGNITVGSEPAGAHVFYNGRQLVDENGVALVTPLTFNTYPPAPPVADPITGEMPEAVVEPLPVTLSREGVPIRIEKEGYMPVVTGVYRHMYTCQIVNPAEGVPFWEACQYTYDTGVFELMTPEEFAPPEAEGSGEGAPETAEAEETAG